MPKVAPAVAGLVRSSDLARLGMQQGLINLSALAKLLHGEINKKTNKEVSLGSIVVALVRLQKQLQLEATALPKISIKELSVRPGLVRFIYAKDSSSVKALVNLYQAFNDSSDYLAVTQGAKEIAIITTAECSPLVQRLFSLGKLVAEDRGLAAVCVSLYPAEGEQQIKYHILSRMLSASRFKIKEILNSDTELTVLVVSEGTEEDLALLSELFKPGLNML